MVQKTKWVTQITSQKTLNLIEKELLKTPAGLVRKEKRRGAWYVLCCVSDYSNARCSVIILQSRGREDASSRQLFPYLRHNVKPLLLLKLWTQMKFIFWKEDRYHWSTTKWVVMLVALGGFLPTPSPSRLLGVLHRLCNVKNKSWLRVSNSTIVTDCWGGQVGDKQVLE